MFCSGYRSIQRAPGSRFNFISLKSPAITSGSTFSLRSFHQNLHSWQQPLSVIHHWLFLLNTNQSCHLQLLLLSSRLRLPQCLLLCHDDMHDDEGMLEHIHERCPLSSHGLPPYYPANAADINPEPLLPSLLLQLSARRECACAANPTSMLCLGKCTVRFTVQLNICRHR